MKRRKPLVSQHLENISGAALEKYEHIVRDFVSGRHGVYALYRRNKLYYVGLAKNLRNRLRAHLRDRHHGSWDRFSVYLTVDDRHLKELESLVLRIVPTTGNKVRGKFAKSENLDRAFQRAVVTDFQQKMRDLLGKGPRLAKEARRRGRPPTKHGSGRLPLAGVFARTVKIRKRFKGELYRARLRRDGRIRYKGKLYESPSLAAKAVTKRCVNGWSFWTYEAGPGKWLPLKRLRR